MKTKFGEWEVIGKFSKNILIVRCSCGKRARRRLWILQKGRSKQCFDCYTRSRKKSTLIDVAPSEPNYKLNNLETGLIIGVAIFITLLITVCACYMGGLFLQ